MSDSVAVPATSDDVAGVADAPTRNDDARSFVHQAAKFSAYAPLALLLLGCLLQGTVKEHRGTDIGYVLAVTLAGICVTTSVVAFVLGTVGFVAGIFRRNVRTVLLAALGMLLNSGYLLHVVRGHRDDHSTSALTRNRTLARAG